MTNDNGVTSPNTPPPVAALVEALEQYANPDAWGTWNSVKCEYIDDGKEWLYSDQGALLARQALQAHQQTAEDWDKVAAFFKAYLSLRDKEYLAIINSEKLIELQNELVAAEDALPQWAKDWAGKVGE